MDESKREDLTVSRTQVPPVALFGAAAASVGGALLVTSLPDDSIASVALQTFVAIPLGLILPVVFGTPRPRLGTLSLSERTHTWV